MTINKDIVFKLVASAALNGMSAFLDALKGFFIKVIEISAVGIPACLLNAQLDLVQIGAVIIQTCILDLILTNTIFTKVIIVTVNQTDSGNLYAFGIVRFVLPTVKRYAIHIENAVLLAIEDLTATTLQNTVNNFKGVAGGRDRGAPLDDRTTRTAVVAGGSTRAANAEDPAFVSSFCAGSVLALCFAIDMLMHGRHISSGIRSSIVKFCNGGVFGGAERNLVAISLSQQALFHIGLNRHKTVRVYILAAITLDKLGNPGADG